MGKDWVADIQLMHSHHGQTLKGFDKRKFEGFLSFRLDFLQEELDEANTSDKADDIVDALIDLCVVAISTLELFGVDTHLAWDRVMETNMAKIPGVKLTRPNPWGLPDLIKPEGWKAPDHRDNTGWISQGLYTN